MVQTRSQYNRFAKAGAPSNSNNDASTSDDKTNADPSIMELFFSEHFLSEEKEDHNSTHYSHAVQVTRKKPADPPSRRVSTMPSPPTNHTPLLQVKEIVEAARKRPSEFVEFSHSKSPKLSSTSQQELPTDWTLCVFEVRQDPPPSKHTIPNPPEQQSHSARSIDPLAQQASSKVAAPSTVNTRIPSPPPLEHPSNNSVPTFLEGV